MSGLHMPYAYSSQESKIVVACKNASLYGKKMHSLHIAGVVLYSDYVVRFRASDDKVAIADLLTAMGRYKTVWDSSHAVRNLINRRYKTVWDATHAVNTLIDQDDIIKDMKSIDIDYTVYDDKVI